SMMHVFRPPLASIETVTFVDCCARGYATPLVPPVRPTVGPLESWYCSFDPQHATYPPLFWSSAHPWFPPALTAVTFHGSKAYRYACGKKHSNGQENVARACIWYVPPVVPSVQLLTVAIPLPSVT